MKEMLCLMSFVLISQTVSLSKNIYVSPSGSDTNTGTSPQSALKSISAALGKATAGDEIRLLPGTYYGKTNVRDIHGAAENPITIVSNAPDSSEFAIIDGESAPAINEFKPGFWLDGASWLTFKNLKFQHCWTDVVVLERSSYISFSGCIFNGGRRVIYPTGETCHHFLVENCYWEQDERVWTSFDWEEMHHGSLEYYNGALFHPAGTGGSYVVRGNVIKNVFNGFRSWPSKYNQDGNGEIYDNIFLNHADNAFEPEQWAWNIHFYHNRLHNIHKYFSIDDVRGGPLYIYGNIITQDDDKNALDKVSGVWKFKDGPLTESCYAFNNSFYTEAKAFKEDEATNQQMKHFNNAYYFFSGSDRFRLTDWHDSFEFDYDCQNQEWPYNITSHNQEQNGIVADALFIDGPAGDLRLQPGSPCIDAGCILSFPEFNWTQRFQDSAPDIGAFEGQAFVEGPPFKFLTPPGGAQYEEKPRIVRHEIRENKLVLYFSLGLNPGTIYRDAFHVFQDDQKIPISNIVLGTMNREVIIHVNSLLNVAKVSIFIDPLPAAENGEQATLWASTITIADKNLVMTVQEFAKSSAVNHNPNLNIFPNPFNQSAKVIFKFNDINIKYEQVMMNIPLQISDIQGRIVKKINPTLKRGQLEYELNSYDLSSGVYFAVLCLAQNKMVEKFLVLK